jgi:alpha-glucosidase (family GH31 glycosyl hydrolase)
MRLPRAAVAALAAAAAAALAAAAPPVASPAPPVVNYTLSYPDGSALRAELLAADGSAVRVVVVPAGASEAFMRYELRVPQPALPAGAGFAVEEHAAYTLLATAASMLNVSKAAPTAELLRPNGTLLSAEPQAVSREPESQCGNGHGGPIRGGCLRAWRSLQPGEGIYGFGVQSYAVNHVGTTKWIQTDANPSALGLDHAPAPFFLSSRGYGVALNTHAYSYFDVGFALPSNSSSPGINLMHTSDPVMDLVFFAGPRLADVMAQFTQLYGRTALPPKFALGLWYHPKEDTNQSGIVETVAAFQANGVKLAAVTLEPPWQTHSYSCTYVVNNKTIWDLPGLLKSLGGFSAEVSLWQHAYIFNSSQGIASPLWEPIYGAGLAADWITWGGATPDWTLQATRDAVNKYMSANFISLGIAAFKLDECDGNAGQVRSDLSALPPSPLPTKRGVS